MWQAEIVKKIIVDGVLHVGVVYKEGETQFRETYSVTAVPSEDWPMDIIRNRLDDLNQIVPKEESLKLGKVTLKPVVDPVVSSPDPAKSEWFDKRRELARKHELVAEGVFTAEELELENLKQEVKDGYKPEYL